MALRTMTTQTIIDEEAVDLLLKEIGSVSIERRKKYWVGGVGGWMRGGETGGGGEKKIRGVSFSDYPSV